MNPPCARRMSRWTAVLMSLALLTAACSDKGNPTRSVSPSSTTASGSDRGSGPETTEVVEVPSGDGFNEAQFEGEPVDGGSIVFGVESEIADLDPAGNLAQPAEIDAALAIFDPLIAIDKNGNEAPNLATQWEASDDLKTWTITLRNAVKFSDGTDFDADAVVTNFERFKDPATRCVCIQSVKAIVKVEAPDPTTVVFTLREPNAFFTSVLAAMNTGFMSSPTALEKFGSDYARNPVGTGPFVLQSFDSLVLKKNPLYWKQDEQGRQLPYLDQIRLRPIVDEQVRRERLQAGDIDAIQTADTDTIADAVADDSFKVQKITGASSTITVFNLRRPPFDDLRMRRAVALSTDRNELNNVLYRGIRQPAFGLFAFDSLFFVDSTPRQDQPAAKSLVDEAIENGVSPKATSSCVATPESRTILSITAAQAARTGLDLANEFLDGGAYVNKVFGASHDFTIGCLGSPQLGDADGLYNSLHSGAASNLGGYANTDVDRWLEEVRATTDRAERVRLLRLVQEQVARDVPIVPLLYNLFAHVYRPTISGFPVPQANSLGAISFATLYRTE